MWYRRPVLPTITVEDAGEELQRQLAFEARMQYESILRTLGSATWVSLPERLRFAEDRLMQLRFAEDCGFRVPDTIIANSKDAVDAFLAQHDCACMKPIFLGQLSMHDSLRLYYTSLVTKNDRDVLLKVHNFPVLLQEYIPKSRELRITVVGQQVFPVEIDAKGDPDAKVDWRIDNGQRVEYKRTNLSSTLFDIALQVVRRFGVMFATMDVILRENGDYYFLDLNPNGQWAWLDQILNLGIAEELRLLLSRRQDNA